MVNIQKRAKELQNEIVENRRWLHAHAEVGFEVQETAEYIKSKLAQMGIRTSEPIKGSVLGVLGEKKKGNAVLLRADIDGLPIQEKSGESFACKNGNMHACGHDMHAATLLGVAKILKERENELSSPVKLLFQPAEEILKGGASCVENGVLENPKVDCALALHVAVGVEMETGTLVVPKSGVGAPAADFFKIKIKGKGCHGSTPQNGVDALTIACRIALSLEEISAREISVSTPAVLTIGTLTAGKADNAIADSAILGGTLRSFDEEVRMQIKKRVKEIAEGIAKTFRGSAKTEFFGGCPCLINDGKIREEFLKCVGQVFDERKILDMETVKNGDLSKKSGGSEDFAFIAEKTPSLLVAICAGNYKKGYAEPLHSPKVRFDENALWVGVVALAGFALYRKK